jgi:hypothetical protein
VTAHYHNILFDNISLTQAKYNADSEITKRRSVKKKQQCTVSFESLRIPVLKTWLPLLFLQIETAVPKELQAGGE